MNAFRFPLQKVLDLRQTQLEMEQVKFKQRAAAVADLDRQRAEIEAAGSRAEMEVRQSNSIEGRELGALDRFRLQVKLDEARIAGQRTEALRLLAAQQELMLQARRRSKLLERLRERRQQEWEAAHQRELEELASESFLAQWNRRTPE